MICRVVVVVVDDDDAAAAAADDDDDDDDDACDVALTTTRVDRRTLQASSLTDDVAAPSALYYATVSPVLVIDVQLTSLPVSCHVASDQRSRCLASRSVASTRWISTTRRCCPVAQLVCAWAAVTPAVAVVNASS